MWIIFWRLRIPIYLLAFLDGKKSVLHFRDLCAAVTETLTNLCVMERILLELKLLSCRDLKAFNFFQKLSVYTVVCLTSEVKNLKPQRYVQQRQKTPVDREGGGNPEWNHTVKFDLNDVPYRHHDDHLYLKFQLCCKGVIFRNRNIGEVYVPLKDLIKESNGNVRFVSYQVRSLNGKPNGVLSFSYKVNGEAKDKRIDTSTMGFRSGVCFPPEKIHHPPAEMEIQSPKTCFNYSLENMSPPMTHYGYSIYNKPRAAVPSPNHFYPSRPCSIQDIYASMTIPPPTIPLQHAALAAGHGFPPQQYLAPFVSPPGHGWFAREATCNNGLHGQRWSLEKSRV